MSLYIPDLSKYPKVCCEEERNVNMVAIGWLESDYSFQVGETPEKFLRYLEKLCSKPIILTLGKRNCPLCGKGPVKVLLSTGNELIIHGTDQIRVPSKDRSKIYAAPNLILHFIKSHGYAPPQEFVDAVQEAPLPGTVEYDQFAEPWKDFHQ